MLLDHSRALGSLLPTQDAFIGSMLEVQSHVIARPELNHWARRLRFLELPSINGAEISSKHSITLSLADKTKFPDETAYVAVSYCWSCSDKDINRYGPCYYVQTNNSIRPSRAPANILDRAILYALRHEIPLIWIDQECIDQEDPQDLKQGVQCMDEVYGLSESPIGLLSAEIANQATFKSFERLLGHFETACMSENPPGDDFLDPNVVSELTKVLCDIAGDRWFYRCWTYQEATCSRNTMKVLIRGNSGNGPSSDISFRLSALWKASSWLRNRAEQVLGQRYEVPGWSTMAELCVQAWEQQRRCSRPCDYEVARCLRQRKNLVVEDRLAITANLCGYAKRLDAPTLSSKGYSYSVCAFGLALLNGSIHPEGCSDVFEASRKPTSRWRSMQIQQFLESPMHIAGVYGNARRNEPRFSEVTLRRSGLEASGWLWDVRRKVYLPGLRARHGQHSERGSFSRSERSREAFRTIIVDMVDELRHLNFPSVAERLAESLGMKSTDSLPYELCYDFPHESFNEAPWMFVMLENILSQGYIWCGAIHGENELKGVFDVDEPCMVFTSTDVAFNDIPRPWAAHNFLSFMVSQKSETSDGVPHLQHSANSVNAIWLPAQTSAKRYIFPWADETYYDGMESDDSVISTSTNSNE